jgi:NhaP-type Na+/H+ or K+/H+ antiporter
VPGSWLPLALFMAIFACKFVVGMLSATVPEQLHSMQAAIGISALYGLFSGVLNARALKLLQLPKHPSHPQKDFP